MSERRLPDDEVDRLLRDALADDLPTDLEDELRREGRRAWHRAASEPRRAAWGSRLGVPAAWRPLLPQPALVGAALGRATAMECAVEALDEHGQRLTYRVVWRAPGETRVCLYGPVGSSERTLRLPDTGSSVLTRAVAASRAAPLDRALLPVQAYLSPSTLGERLDAPWRPAPRGGDAPHGTETFVVGPGSGPPGLTVGIDISTHLPLRLDATDRDGRTQAAVCRWP
jgi:hypothetical protein